MASTPIYNWPTPDNTGLVKNGALDMRTLGNAIDTTMATMVPKTIVDAKGDLIAATAADTTARLAVGANGETLVADSSTATGLKWAAPSSGSSYVAGKNFVINGGFDIWQRGTSFASAANVYTTDRWLIYRSGGNLTTSRVATGDTTNLPNIQYATRLQRTASSTSTDIVYFMNMFETVNTIPLVGQTVTLSFYARRGANYSATSNILNASIRTGTGTDQNWISGYTGEATPLTTNATLTTTWQRFTVSGTIATTANELTVLFQFTPTGTAGAADLVEITGVQLEVSASATAFSRACGTIQGELAACQRYFMKYSSDFLGSALSVNLMANGLFFPVTMRTTPTFANGSYNTGTFASQNLSKTSAQLYNGATTWTTGTNVTFTLDVSAEL